MIHYFGGKFKFVSQSAAMLAVALGTALFFLDLACCCWLCSAAAAAAAALFFSRLSSSRKSLVLTFKDKIIEVCI